MCFNLRRVFLSKCSPIAFEKYVYSFMFRLISHEFYFETKYSNNLICFFDIEMMPQIEVKIEQKNFVGGEIYDSTRAF